MLLYRINSAVLSTAFRKNFLFLAFNSKLKYFVLIDHILSETTCLSCFFVLFSNIYHKIKFTSKNWFDPYNFYRKLDFGKLLLKYFYFSSLILNYCHSIRIF